MQPRKIAVIGAGAMGLACAYDLLKKGYYVDIYESQDRIGGMSSSFEFDGMNIEKFYHFVCGPDYPLFGLMKELNIFNQLKWTETKMGFYYQGELYKWGNPLYLLGFPKASMVSKLRYGLHLFLASKRTSWEDLDTKNAIEWIKNAVGEEAYRIFWQPLFELKFYEYADNISAAWIWTRIKRVALSRKNLFVERMGYIQGGSDTLFNALAGQIRSMQGNILLNSPVQRVSIRENKIDGIEADGKMIYYDDVISTIPLPYISSIMPDLPNALKQKFDSAKNIGVVCVIMKLDRSLTDNFWLNVNDASIAIPGMIEYSNLNPLKEHILYVPFYLDTKNPKYSLDDDCFINEVKKYLPQINSSINEKSIMAAKVHRYQYAQPVCPPRYLSTLPNVSTGINGLFIADTSYYYPEDRSISESIRIGRQLAMMLNKG